MSKAIKLGISIGDTNGVGLEVILKSFHDKRMLDFCTPILFGDYQLAMNTKKQLGLEEINLHKILFHRCIQNNLLYPLLYQQKPGNLYIGSL